MKKVLSLVLVIAMVLSSMSFAFAGTFTDVADTDYAEAIETLKALGVITGYEDGSFKPEKTVTRAEMAKLMVELLGYGDLVSGSKSNFTDTQGHWADQWIALAAGRGIVIGTGDGKFNPDGIVTYDQVLTMLVRGLGYTDSSNELKNMPWPTNFKVKAAELNITKNVNMGSVNADRGGVAQAMYNALDQQLVKVNSDGDIVKEFTTKGSRTDIPVNLITRIATPNYAFEVGFQHINPEDKNYAGDKVDLTPYLFQTVEAYFSKINDKEVVFVGDVESLTYADTFESVDGKDLEVGDYTFDVTGAAVSYNNDEASLNDVLAADLDDAKITVVLALDETRIKDDADVVGVIVEKASSYVQIEEEYKADATTIDEIYLPVKNKKVDDKNLIVKGDATELADIEVDDIVAVYAPLDDDATVEATDKLTLAVSRKTVEGKITGISGEDYFVDRVKYKVNDGLNIDTLDIDDEGTFYLDDNGKIIAFKGESEGSKTYAVVVDDVVVGEYKKSESTGKFTVSKAPTVKLATAADEKITYKFDIEIDKATETVKGDLGKIFELNKTDKEIVLKSGDAAEYYEELVSYTLNKDGEITQFGVAGRVIEDVRTSSSSFVLASNAVIFDKEGNVIDKDDLGTKVSGKAVYQNGKIVALLTDIEVEEGTEYYAYVTKIGRDTDTNGDEVQRLTAYINGAKNENLYTTDKGMVTDGTKEVYILKLNDDGEVIEDGTVVTAAAISAKATSVDVKAGEMVIGGKTYFVDQGATIIELSGTSTVNVRNLNAIKKDTTEFNFYADGDTIKYIIIDNR